MDLCPFILLIAIVGGSGLADMIVRVKQNFKSILSIMLVTKAHFQKLSIPCHYFDETNIKIIELNISADLATRYCLCFKLSECMYWEWGMK